MREDERELMEEIRQLKQENKKLKSKNDKIYNANGILAEKISELEKELKELRDYFADDYFQGLTPDVVIGLAKKSIRMTTENCELRKKIENVIEFVKDNSCFAIEAKDILQIIGDKKNV